jgi:hypothetical protein
MLRSGPIRSPGAVLYRSEAVKAVGGLAREQREASQDLDLNLRIAREHPICCNDRVVLLKRFHGENAILQYGDMLRGSVRARRRQRDFVDRHPIYKRDYQAGLRLAQRHWGSRLAGQVLSEARSGEIRVAVRDLGVLARYAPRAGARAIYRACRAYFGRST